MILLPTPIKKYRILKIKSTELTKVNKLKGPSEDASIPLVKKKAFTRVEGGMDLGGKWNKGERREHDLVLGGGKEQKC